MRLARTGLPPLVLMTDDERLSDPMGAAAALPRGSMVVVRARDSKTRALLGEAMLKLARKRGLVVLIAEDTPLAARLGADGIHLAEASATKAMHWRARYPSMIITTSAHTLRAAMRARALPVDAIFLSPVFATRSHPDGKPLTAMRAIFVARTIATPVYALGGVTAQNANLLAHGVFAGIAAIGALAF